MGTATTPLLVCRFCGGRQIADEHDCTGCGARLERPATGNDTTARLLEMSTHMNRLLHRTATAERDRNRRLRTGIVTAVVCFALFVAASDYLSNFAGTSPGVHVDPSVAAGRSAVEERQRDVAYQMMVSEGVFLEREPASPPAP